MSQIYSTEPQTAGRVIFETTHGPLEINLWSRECPATTRYFLQLCLDGYYENVLFHRIVPNFLVQTGALRYNPTSRGSKAKSQVTSLDKNVNPKDLQSYRRRVQADQALERRQYELNNRIRFNHRGQVAMALVMESEGMGEEEMGLMQPQFFITLDEASELDGKHVCFGTVTGPTVFNALRIGNTDVDEETNQPTILEEAPRIERVKILENPIHSDIVPSPGIMPWNASTSGDDANGPKTKKKKRKGVKNVNVLSFGDEMEQDIDAGAGIKSSHDVIETKRFSKQVDKKLRDAVLDKDKDENSDEHIDKPPMSKRQKVSQELEAVPLVHQPPPVLATPGDDVSQPPAPSVSYKASVERKQEESKSTKLSLETLEEEPHLKKEKAPKVSLVEARRAKYAKRGSKDKKNREQDTMAKFMAFQTKVTTRRVEKSADDSKGADDDGIAARMAKRTEKEQESVVKDDTAKETVVTYHGQVLENDDDAEGDWMTTRFKCRKHQDLDAKLGGDGRNAMEDYEVVDEKERGGDGRRRRKHHHHKKPDGSHDPKSKA